MKKEQNSGLNDVEVKLNRDKYGSNELVKTKKESLFIKIFHIITEPMFLLLIITASIYFLLGEAEDGFIMLFFVMFIITIEVVEENKTSKAIEALNELSAINVLVIRNNKKILIDTKDIVVGDIVILNEGDKVPADGIILECQGLGINESILTGESTTVYKSIEDKEEGHFKKNMCYAQTSVVNGEGIIKLTNVGLNTVAGKIGSTLNEIKKEKTPLEKQIKKLITICTVVSLTFFVLVVLLNFIFSSNLSWQDNLINAILKGITVAMATIPEEIPVVFTVFLALGAWDLAKKNALTRNMKAVETLGAVNVLCTDKTGTLTENKMEIKEVLTFDKDFLSVLALSCLKTPYDPMEQAIQSYCFQNGINESVYNHNLIHEYAFNNEDKIMGQVWELNDEKFLSVKGSFESVIPMCELDENKLKEIMKVYENFLNKGYRVLAVAEKHNVLKITNNLKENNLNFVGLIGLEDPPKQKIESTIKSCYEAGIRIIIITGDNGLTAKHLAKKIGIKNYESIINGQEIEKMSEEELKEKVKKTTIFARVYPEHKMKIVSALQSNHDVVAMIGDGINDAPALKKAEIGIAMGKRGTKVAKEAADMILMDDNFNTIVESIKNGRNIYLNIKKAIKYILAIHIPIAVTSLLIPILKLPSLFIPIHIVLLELVIDPTSSIVFQRIKEEKNIMCQNPRNLNEQIINNKEFLISILQGTFIFLAVFLNYYYLLKNGFSENYSRTVSFTILIISNIFMVYVLMGNKFAWQNFLDSLKDKIMVLINIVVIIMLLLIIYLPILNNLVSTLPLSFASLIYVIFISGAVTLIFDLLKLKSLKK